MDKIQENKRNACIMNINILVNEAMRHNSWIYEADNKTWYTPEEFLERFGQSNYSQGWIEKFKIMDPIAGLKAADKQIQMIIEKRQDFQQKVFSYYQTKAIK
jgi:hypothetical protein